MDAELKAKWVTALRSGEYEQCRGSLHRNGAHCALGVLDLLTGGGINAVRVRGMQDVMDMNDDAGKSFAEIADYIEAHL